MKTKTLYETAIHHEQMNPIPPTWFMRQAGRYHQHYQNLKRNHSFMDLCKNPDLACETTFGPMEEFGFDAAILFSDLLFPLEALGMGLEYSPGPKMGWHLKEKSDVSKLNPEKKSTLELVQTLSYQGDALQKIRRRLDPSKTLLGFVGAPFTLFAYACDGSHQGGLPTTKAGLTDGRWDGFLEHIVPFLVENLSLQARSGADAIAIMDTCAGEIPSWDYQARIVPSLREVMVQFRRRHPNTPLVYYSKKTTPEYWQHLKGLPFECKGIDWNLPLDQVLKDFGSEWAIQGNFDPHKMLLTGDAFEKEVRAYFDPLIKLPQKTRSSWISGLGHGVLQWTPEKNVHRFLEIQREVFSK